MSDAVKKPEQKKTRLPFFKILFRVIPLVFRAAPGEFLLFEAVGVIHSLSWVAAVFINQWFYDALSRAAFAGGPASAAFFGAFLVAGITIACQVLNGLHNFWYRPLYEKTQGRLSELVHRKAGLLRAECFEDKEKLDHINKAVEGMRNAVSLSMGFFGLFTFYLPFFLFLFVYFWRLKPLLDMAFIIIFIPVFLSQIVRARLHARLEDDAAPLRRVSFI
jgi:ATP-binding cassette subfamily B protein